MPYAQSGDLRIDYRAEDSGPLLVLQHGFGTNLVNWYELG